MSNPALLRAGYGFAAQAASSLANILVVIGVARSAGVDEYAIYAFAWVVVTFLLGLQRSSLGSIFAVEAKWQKRPFSFPEPRQLLGIASAYGLVCAGMTAALTVIVTGTISGPVLVLSAACVLMMGQDFLRTIALCANAEGRVLLSDGIWLAAMIVPMGLSAAGYLRTLDATAFVSAWFVGLLLSAVYLATALRPRVAFKNIRGLLRARSRELLTLLLDGVLGRSTPLIVSVFAVSMLSVADIAAQRGSNTLVGPIGVLFTAMPLVLLPRLVRRRGPSLRGETLIAAALLAIVIAWVCVLTMLPSEVGQGLLGDTWEIARPLLVVVGVEFALMGVVVPYQMQLRASRRFTELLVIRAWYFGAAIVFSLIAIIVWDSILAVAWALVLASAVVLVLTVYARSRLHSEGKDRADVASS